MGKPDRSLFRGYWNLDEASGDAIDSTANGNTLTETSGTIASAEGGRDFELGDTEYFTRADNASLSFADEAFTIGAWVKLESQTFTRVILSKWDWGLNKREYLLWYDDTDDRYEFRISGNGTENIGVLANNYGAVPATTKAFVIAWHDPVANKIYIQVDNGVVDELAHTTGCNDNTTAFALGTYFNSGAQNSNLDGIEWSAFVYAGLMTADERTWMYNSGTPRKWSEIYFVPRAGMI